MQPRAIVRFPLAVVVDDVAEKVRGFVLGCILFVPSKVGFETEFITKLN